MADPPTDAAAPRIAVAMITKDSVGVIDRCLDSVTGHVDEICIYDTGSRDGTVEHLQARSDVVVRLGEWRDDFAWARQQSFAMVSDEIDWVLWLDDDDELVGAEHLAELVASMEPHEDGLGMLYEYTRNENGNVVLQLWRERIVRRSGGLRWQGVVHESLQRSDGARVRLRRVDPAVARVVHFRPAGRYEPTRNLGLLQSERERAKRHGSPVDDHTLVYLATEHMARQEYEPAITLFEEYLRRPSEWPEQRAQIHHRLATCRLRTGDAGEAVAVELRSLDELDDWPETSAGLTEAYAALGRWDEVEHWAKRTLELGPPRSELPVNPAEFTFVPLIHLAEACFRQGRADEGQEWLARAWEARGNES